MFPKADAIEFLQRIVDAHGPSGFEHNVQQTWLARIRDVADAVHSDAYGNVWAELSAAAKTNDAPTVVVTGHSDEIGLMVGHIESNGLLRVVPIGGVDPAILPGRRVLVHAGGGDLPGVVGAVPIHLQDRSGDRKAPKIDELFLDCGFADGDEAGRRVRVGTPVTMESSFGRLGKALAVSRVFDNRIGIFTAAETFRRVARRRKSLRVRLVALSTVQEEIGTVGASFATRTINPDIAFCVDVCHGTDVPGISHAKHGSVKLGGGPTVTHGTSNHRLLVERLIAVAKKCNITLQHEASSRFTGTDTDAIYRATRGIPSALVSLPTRYMHTPSEVIHLGDLEQLVGLLTEAVLDLQPGDGFNVVRL